MTGELVRCHDCLNSIEAILDNLHQNIHPNSVPDAWYREQILRCLALASVLIAEERTK